MNSDDAVVGGNPVVENGVSVNRIAFKKDKKDRKNRNNFGNQKKNLILSKEVISDGDNSNNEVVTTNDAVVEAGSNFLTRTLTLLLISLTYLFIYSSFYLFTYSFFMLSC